MVNDYFWGFTDKDLLKEGLAQKKEHGNQPYLDIYFTGTMHSPFYINDAQDYQERLRKTIEGATDSQVQKQFEKYAKEYQTTLYTDDALRQFFKDFSQRKEFENTIFVITGDHPITEVPVQNKLKRYHVPLLIYSPKIKTPASSKNIVSHLDVYQSLLNILSPYGIKSPRYSTSLGTTLKIPQEKEEKPLIFMDGDRVIREIYSNGYFYTENKLYKVAPDFSLKRERNMRQKQMLLDRLEAFQYVNLWSTYFDRLFPIEEFYNFYQQRIIHHEVETEKEQTSEEFIHLYTSSIQQNQGELNANIKLHYINHSSKTSIVFEIKNKNGDTQYWTNHGLPISTSLKNYTEIRQSIPIQEDYLNTILNIYIWNPEKKEIEINQKEHLIYSKN